MSLQHPILHITQNSKNLYYVFLNKGVTFSNPDLLESILKIFPHGFGSKSVPFHMNQIQLQTLITSLNTILSKYNPDSDSESENGSESDEEENEETIQQVLARRFKSESTQSVIEEDTIENSEDEDVISNSRRIRYLLKEFNILKNKINDLKQS